MTDQELLEMAARAAGITLAAPGRVVSENGHTWPWDPLNDDGDALRLAVDLRITVGLYGGKGVTADASWQDKDVRLIFKGDPHATVRRAIVRAAAAMAKEG